jgi:hypothetical protein
MISINRLQGQLHKNGTIIDTYQHQESLRILRILRFGDSHHDFGLLHTIQHHLMLICIDVDTICYSLPQLDGGFGVLSVCNDLFCALAEDSCGDAVGEDDVH